MTYSLEVIVNTGQFEHAKLTLSADSEEMLDVRMAALSDGFCQRIGVFAVGVKSQILAGKSGAVPDTRPPAQLIEEELGGKIVEVTEHQEKPAWAVSMDPEPKPWESGTPKADTMVIEGEVIVIEKPNATQPTPVAKPGDDW